MKELEQLRNLEEISYQQLRINFKPYTQIYYWTQAAKGEVSGWGKARKDENGVYTITEIILLEQQCSAAFTDFTDEAITDFLFWCGKYKKNPAEFNFWWHSHCDMGTFWSGTDQGTMAMYSQTQPFIALVTNKRGEMRAQYNFKGAAQTMGTVVIPTGHQDIQKQCYQEVEEKVKGFAPSVQDIFRAVEVKVKTCSNCFYPDGGVCEFVGEIEEDFCCENWTPDVGVVTRVPKGCGPVKITPIKGDYP